MAIDPKVKARAVAELVAGKTLEQVSKKHKVSTTQLKTWMRAIRKPQESKQIPHDRRLSAYHAALEKFALAALDMLTAQAELLSDADFLRKRETSDIVHHTTFVHERLLKHIELERALRSTAPALPAGGESGEAIEPELVEDAVEDVA